MKLVQQPAMSSADAAQFVGLAGALLVDKGIFALRVLDGVNQGGNLLLSAKANLADLTDASAARNALGLGTAALLDADAGFMLGSNNLSEITDQTESLLNIGAAARGANTDINSVLFNDGGFHQKNSAVAHATQVIFVDGITADRTFTIHTGDANRVFTLSGDATISGSHTGTASGVNTGDQTITLTGDVTGSGTGSFGTTIANASIGNAKMANMPAGTFKGNNTGSAGVPLDLTATQATAALNGMVGDSGSGGTKGMVPAPGAGDAAGGKFLKADGTWATPSAKKFVTAQIAATANTLPFLNVAHGLGGKPDLLMGFIINTSPELDYQIGDIVPITDISGSSNNYGGNVTADVNGVSMIIGPSGFYVFDRSFKTISLIDGTKWNCYIVAIKF